ncbi:cytochrome P450 [Sorangium sp. So ce1153]|uniref:cytochrome P450 n=1 Tax=Sorangium sp. So ce1153 TaxID=3133333 RepID=UPI003F5FB956
MFPALSSYDALVYNLGYLVPYVMQGIFTERRLWVHVWLRLHPDPGAVRFFGRMRRKYGSGCFWVRVGLRSSLVVLDRDAVRRVLELSPDTYQSGSFKREGMRVFMPKAVTISRGEAWRDRRRFNEAVLEFHRSRHRYAARFLSVVQEEVELASRASLLSWDDFDRLFETITRRIVFGDVARDDTEVLGLLRRMMAQANWLIRPRRSRYFDPFYARVRRYLDAAEPCSLAALARQVPATELTAVEQQIPHWLFAMWQTLGINTARALALIVAHRDVEREVRREMAGGCPTASEGIDGLALLGGCVQEAMRLFPTTPLLFRETTVPDVLEGAAVPARSPVLIPNSFNHRDRERVAIADAFCPAWWLSGEREPLFNHLGGGAQVCAGRSLLLFLAKAVLAALLSRRRYTLVRPALSPARPIPYAFNYLRARFEASPIEADENRDTLQRIHR